MHYRFYAKQIFSPDFKPFKKGSHLLRPVNFLIYGLDNSYPTWQADNSNRFLYLLQWLFRIILFKTPLCQHWASCSLHVSPFTLSLLSKCGGYPRIFRNITECLLTSTFSCAGLTQRREQHTSFMMHFN